MSALDSQNPHLKIIKEMCLLSFARIDNQAFFTSNRDISVKRASPQEIMAHTIGVVDVSFPKDIKGGSWLAFDETKILFLLNGAEANHPFQSFPYRKSRGLVLLDLFVQSDLIAEWEEVDLDNIEPFTIISYSVKESLLNKFVWDGNTKKVTTLDSGVSHTWMSSTLYTDDEKLLVNNRFMNTEFEHQDALLEFHKLNNYKTIKQYAEVIPDVQTTCITQFCSDDQEIQLLHSFHR